MADYRCPRCGSIFTTRKDLQRHIVHRRHYPENNLDEFTEVEDDQ